MKILKHNCINQNKSKNIFRYSPNESFSLNEFEGDPQTKNNPYRFEQPSSFYQKDTFSDKNLGTNKYNRENLEQNLTRDIEEAEKEQVLYEGNFEGRKFRTTSKKLDQYIRIITSFGKNKERFQALKKIFHPDALHIAVADFFAYRIDNHTTVDEIIHYQGISDRDVQWIVQRSLKLTAQFNIQSRKNKGEKRSVCEEVYREWKRKVKQMVPDTNFKPIDKKVQSILNE